jgi:predicted amidohydrolase
VSAPVQDCHGHSCIIGPNGEVLASSRDNAETIVFADLDVARATREAALARGKHPALRAFWEAGMQLLSGGATIETPEVKPLASAEAEITIAAAQVTGDLPGMIAAIEQARAKGAHLVVFPARAIPESAISALQSAARQQRITVVVGAERRASGDLRNSAFVIGPDGSLLTCYDQLSAKSPYQPGSDPRAMWFRVNGVPAIVTVEWDAHWTELAELAAVVGARIHVHLDHDRAATPADDLRRLQVWANLVSFHNFSATVNVVGSAIWDDLRDAEERRAAVRDLPRPQTGEAELYSPFSANVVVRAGATPELIVATRKVTPINRHYPDRTRRMNPQMDSWYRLGAEMIRPR